MLYIILCSYKKAFFGSEKMIAAIVQHLCTRVAQRGIPGVRHESTLLVSKLYFLDWTTSDNYSICSSGAEGVVQATAPSGSAPRAIRTVLTAHKRVGRPRSKHILLLFARG